MFKEKPVGHRHNCYFIVLIKHWKNITDCGMFTFVRFVALLLETFLPSKNIALPTFDEVCFRHRLLYIMVGKSFRDSSQ